MRWFARRRRLPRPSLNDRRAERRRAVFEGLEHRLVLSTANPNAVTQAYLDLLHRPTDPAGLAYWTDQLDRGGNRGEIARKLTHSDEYFANIVIAPAYQ